MVKDVPAFILLVAKMRDAQKAFYGAEHGTPEKKKALLEALSIEKRVDKLLSSDDGPNLFEEE
jgi:hypothetical protein